MDFPEDNAAYLLDAACRDAELWVQAINSWIADIDEALKRVKPRPSGPTQEGLKAERETWKVLLPLRIKVREAALKALTEAELPVPILTYDGITGVYTWSYPE